MILLKTCIRFIAVLCLFMACTQPSAKKAAVLPDDSLQYYPPTPGEISKEEFRTYYRACQQFFDSTLDNQRFNGSILVAKNGKVIFERYIGYTNPAARKDSLGPNHAFHLASVSKTFTAMATLKLWQDGKISLEDELGKYFENFPYPGVTIKMLLNHRSGLPNYVHYLEQNGWDKKKLVTNADVLNSLYTMHPPLQFATGKRFAYCNTNYALLALLIEKVSGKPYPAFLQETFFTPLQMKDTYVFSETAATTAMPSFMWDNRQYPMEFLDLTYGDKNIYSTVQDMLKWDQALYSNQLFKPATLDSAFAGYSFEKEGKRNYGLGWRMTFIDNGKKILYHNGWWHGNNTVFIRLLDEKATIIVLGNRYTQKIYSARKLCDVFGAYAQNKTHIEEGEMSGSGGSPSFKAATQKK